MKAVILAGGFAKRLWPLTKEKAKPLVEVGGKPIISHIVNQLDVVQDIDEIFVSTNEKFSQDFEKWAAETGSKKKITVVVEGTNHEGEKLGAIGGLQFVLEKIGADDVFLVIAGDNFTGIDLNKMLEMYRKKKTPVVAVYDIKDREVVKHLGEITLGEGGKIVRFREKPHDPETTLIATCCYIFPRGIKEKIGSYIESGGNKDAPGFFIEWLSEKEIVHAHTFDSFWFDIGSQESLKAAREFVEKFSKK